MLTNPRAERVKAVRALLRRAARVRSGLFLAEGPQAVREAVTSDAAGVVGLYVTTEAAARHTAILDAAANAGIRTHPVSDEVLAAMAGTGSPQGLLAVCRQRDVPLADVLAARPRLLVLLAHVRDPGNAGTVIRAADAVGADAVLVSDASVDVYNPKVVRASAGSVFHVPVVTGLPVETILGEMRHAGLRLFAADGSAPESLDDADLTGSHAWVMGNEAWGLPESTRDACDAVVRVPIYGKAESLNLAMATTVCLYASARQQRARR